MKTASEYVWNKAKIRQTINHPKDNKGTLRGSRDKLKNSLQQGFRQIRGKIESDH